MIAQIRNAPLPEAFYESLLQALQSSFTYDRLLISWINDLPNSELAAQVVDFMIRYEDIDWAVCAGIHRIALFSQCARQCRGASRRDSPPGGRQARRPRRRP